MPSLQELSDKVDQLQTALDSEQVAIQDAINALNQTIATLEEQVATGGTEEERQAILDKLNSVVTDLEATIP